MRRLLAVIALVLAPSMRGASCFAGSLRSGGFRRWACYSQGDAGMSFRVIRGLGYGLDESAINTVATKWRFKPGSLNGRPVDVQANIEVTFRLY